MLILILVSQDFVTARDKRCEARYEKYHRLKLLIYSMYWTGDTDNTEGGAKGGAKEAERGGETQDGAAGGAVWADHRWDAAETVG